MIQKIENQAAYRRIPSLVWMLFAVGLGLSGCGSNQTATEPARGINLMERFRSGQAGSPVRHSPVVRKGDHRDALLLVAPEFIRSSLKDASGRMTLKITAAAVFNAGDGFQMNVFLNRAGARVSVFGRFFNPGNKAEDRCWIPLTVPLHIVDGDSLEIEVTGGPQANLDADWLALSSIQLTNE
jgi:hypothetical protein